MGRGHVPRIPRVRKRERTMEVGDRLKARIGPTTSALRVLDLLGSPARHVGCVVRDPSTVDERGPHAVNNLFDFPIWVVLFVFIVVAGEHDDCRDRGVMRAMQIGSLWLLCRRRVGGVGSGVTAEDEWQTLWTEEKLGRGGVGTAESGGGGSLVGIDCLFIADRAV